MSTRRPDNPNRRGGPATEHGKAIALANLVEGHHLTHQVSRFLRTGMFPSCDYCCCGPTGNAACVEYRKGETCQVAEREQGELFAAVRDEVGVSPASVPLAREYAKIATAILIADLWFSTKTPFKIADDGALGPQDLMRTRLQLSSRLQSLAAELGLTPASRARLRAQVAESKEDSFRRISREADELVAAQKAASVDAQFEPLEEGADHGSNAAEGSDADAVRG